MKNVPVSKTILYLAIIDSNGKVESMTNANEADPAVIDKSSPTQEATSLTSKPINEMSVDELQQLSEESNKELADRARQAEQG